MKIGLIAVDKTKFPNIALGKISAYHKAKGDIVEWAMGGLFGADYDKIYASKIFTFSEDVDLNGYDCEIVKGGTGYALHKELPQEIDRLQPDYSIFPQVDSKTAYGFLTRGCPNKCKWCVVPIKEGNIHPYMDVDEIAMGGKRPNLVLMDNNILACDYGLQQIEKIIHRGYRVDFNQAMDARLVTDDIAKLLAKVKWINSTIRFGCDTPKQITECERAMKTIDNYSDRPKPYLLYTMIHGGIEENYERLSYFKDNKKVRIVAQPYRNFNNPNQFIPQWQKDMTRWAMRRELWTSCDFKDFEPRKGFRCKEYFNR